MRQQLSAAAAAEAVSEAGGPGSLSEDARRGTAAVRAEFGAPPQQLPTAEFRGYVFKIKGGQDKQGFPMKQGVLTSGRVRVLMSPGDQCFRGYGRRNGERRRKSVRGCIVSPDLSVLNLVIVKKAAGAFVAGRRKSGRGSSEAEAAPGGGMGRRGSPSRTAPAGLRKLAVISHTQLGGCPGMQFQHQLGIYVRVGTALQMGRRWGAVGNQWRPCPNQPTSLIQGEQELPGLTDEEKPKMRGPKRAARIRKMFNLTKDDDVRHYVKIYGKKVEKKNGKTTLRCPKIQRLVTPQTLQRERRRNALRRERITRKKTEEAEYHKLLVTRIKEERERRSESLAKKRALRTASQASKEA
ncbi:hypothetical protein N2152v2_004383 [Parachlorella kessleri]